MAAETLRRHTRRSLLWQQRRCGVTFAHCCCGSRDVAASHSQTAVAAAEALRRHIRRLLLRQQRRCGVTFAHCCCGSRDVAASHSQTAVAAAETLRRHTRRLLLRQQIRCIAVAPALVVTQLSACDGVHHTCSCRDRSTYDVVEYIVQLLQWLLLQWWSTSHQLLRPRSSRDCGGAPALAVVAALRYDGEPLVDFVTVVPVHALFYAATAPFVAYIVPSAVFVSPAPLVTIAATVCQERCSCSCCGAHRGCLAGLVRSICACGGVHRGPALVVDAAAGAAAGMELEAASDQERSDFELRQHVARAGLTLNSWR